MTFYRKALETIIAMVRKGDAPGAVAYYLGSIPELQRWEVLAKVRGVAVAGTFAEAVLKALEPVSKPKAEDGNPVYPALPSVNKFRKLANKRDLTAEETKAYGRSVLEGIRQLQRQEIMRGVPRLPSAKYETGADVLKRIAAENKAAFARDCQSDRAARSDADIVAAYHAAMAAKRGTGAAFETAITPVTLIKPAPDHSARMRKAWETRRANAAKRAA